jgi:hypothetical protein
VVSLIEDDDRTIARRVLVHLDVDQLLSNVTELLGRTSCPSQSEGRRLGLLVEAVGDVAAAMTHGHGAYDEEIRMCSAMCQSWLESNERRRAL